MYKKIIFGLGNLPSFLFSKVLWEFAECVLTMLILSLIASILYAPNNIYPFVFYPFYHERGFLSNFISMLKLGHEPFHPVEDPKVQKSRELNFLLEN